MDFAELIERAKTVLHERRTSEECIVGEVSAALLSEAGNVYLGISIDTACGIGFCAEHGAVAEMVKAGESRVTKAVAIASDGKILPPCGRCRELLYQVNHANLGAEILLPGGRMATLGELLPERWQELWE